MPCPVNVVPLGINNIFLPRLGLLFFFFTRFCLLAEYVSGRISWPKTEAYAAGNGNKYRSARKA